MDGTGGFVTGSHLMISQMMVLHAALSKRPLRLTLERH